MRRIRRAVWCTAVGVAGILATVAMCAISAITTLHAIALALPAETFTLVGVLQMTVPDALTAWRRGFQHGCQAALRSQADVLMPDVPERSSQVALTDRRPDTDAHRSAGSEG